MLASLCQSKFALSRSTEYISKPSFVLIEKAQELFLGEIKSEKAKKINFLLCFDCKKVSLSFCFNIYFVSALKETSRYHQTISVYTFVFFFLLFFFTSQHFVSLKRKTFVSCSLQGLRWNRFWIIFKLSVAWQVLVAWTFLRRDLFIKASGFRESYKRISGLKYLRIQVSPLDVTRSVYFLRETFSECITSNDMGKYL